ncbi:Anoctamin-5 [Portunus trituberculatus]|uniref:Anoctamin n=1 Tax=Portunus trituberculatus TaxID=210409 RepID=A0A5B7D884_PORTR|nr:Anoctamin-5 [Portunus trituberculatus]
MAPRRLISGENKESSGSASICEPQPSACGFTGIASKLFMDSDSSSDDLPPPPHPSSLLFYIIHHQSSLMAVVISYTSDFIPRLVYMYGYSPKHNLVGYIKNTLSVFNTSEYKENMGPEKRDGWPAVCHYRAYRNGPDDENPYDINQQFWHVFTARLAFILIFEHVVFLLTGAVAMAIPDIPVEVRNQMKREKKFKQESQNGRRGVIPNLQVQIPAVEKETLFENEMRKIRQERQERQVLTPDEDHLNLDLGEGLRTTCNSRAASPLMPTHKSREMHSSSCCKETSPDAPSTEMSDSAVGVWRNCLSDALRQGNPQHHN